MSVMKVLHDKVITFPELLPKKKFKMYEGTTRIVFVLGRVVIKFPRIYYPCKNRLKISLGYIIGKLTDNLPYFLRAQLLENIIENWREYRLWRNTKSPLLMPTYFSLFGLLNIQKSGDDLQRTQGDSIGYYVVRSEAKSIVGHEGHSVFCDEDWKIRDDGIRLVDYGGEYMPTIVLNSGGDIFRKIQKDIFIYKALNSPKLTPEQYELILEYQDCYNDDRRENLRQGLEKILMI